MLKEENNQAIERFIYSVSYGMKHNKDQTRKEWSQVVRKGGKSSYNSVT